MSFIKRKIRELRELTRIFKRLREAEAETLAVARNCNRLNEERIAAEQKWEGMYENACARADRAEGDRLNWERVAAEFAQAGERAEERIKALYHRRPSMVVETKQGKERRDVERLLVLAGRAESDLLWETIVSYADEHERTEREAALRPEAYPAGAMHPGRAMTDGERHYNAGRAASAYDFATALRDLLAEAQVEARKLKGES